MHPGKKYALTDQEFVMGWNLDEFTECFLFFSENEGFYLQSKISQIGTVTCTTPSLLVDVFHNLRNMRNG